MLVSSIALATEQFTHSFMDIISVALKIVAPPYTLATDSSSW